MSEQIEYRRGAINAVECFKQGFEIIKPNYWMLFAVTLVGALIGGLTFNILLGAMICGINFCFLNAIDGKKVNFDDLWKGFSHFWASLPVVLLIVVPMILVLAILYVPILLSVVMGSKLSEDELVTMLFGAFAVDLVVAVVMVCLHSLLIFSFPLIADRNLGGVKAITTSAKAVFGNMGGVGMLIVLNFVAAFLGYLACGIGLYFVIPIILAANTVAFRQVFPKGVPQNAFPPAPQYYQ